MDRAIATLTGCAWLWSCGGAYQAASPPEESPLPPRPQTARAPTPDGVRGLRLHSDDTSMIRWLGQPSFAEVRNDPSNQYSAVAVLAWRNAFAAAGFLEVEDRAVEHDLKIEFIQDQISELEWALSIELLDARGAKIETVRLNVTYAQPPFMAAPGSEQVAPELQYIYNVCYDAAVRSLNELLPSPNLAAFAANLRKKPEEKRPARVHDVVAVFDVEDSAKSFDAATTDQLTEYLVARVSQVGYRVVPRDQLRARISETKVEGYKACYDQSCQIELGKATAAEKSLATKLLRIGDSCAMTSTLYDLKTETTERAASARTDCSASALLTGVDKIVEQLSE